VNDAADLTNSIQVTPKESPEGTLIELQDSSVEPQGHDGFLLSRGLVELSELAELLELVELLATCHIIELISII
jgi:hypothetical protein